MWDSSGLEVGHVRGIVQTPEHLPSEVRVVLGQEVLHLTQAPQWMRMLRVPATDVEDRDGRVVLKNEWEAYRGPPFATFK